MLVHGVGIGPWSYAALAADVAADHEVVVVHRRGYGRSAGLPSAPGLHDQVEDLARLAGGPAAFVGVSGGATLVLALVLAFPDLVTAAVVHEPVLGPLAPALHAGLGEAAGRLASSPGPVGAVEFVRALVGAPTFDALGPAQRVDVAACEEVIRAEVPQFLGFSPTPAALQALAGRPVLGTVGATSPRGRHAAAAVVASHTGRSTVVLAGVGHLAQLEGPAGLAGALRSLERGAGGHQDVLPAGRGDELQADR